MLLNNLIPAFEFLTIWIPYQIQSSKVRIFLKPYNQMSTAGLSDVYYVRDNDIERVIRPECLHYD